MAANDWPDGLDLDDLVPYTSASASWSDRHSCLSVYWPDAGKPGLQCLHAQIGWGGGIITESLLEWSVTDNGESVESKLKKRIFRPDCIREEVLCGRTAIRTTAAWPARNVLALVFDVRNNGGSPKKVQFAFQYPGKGVRPDWEGPFPVGQFVSAAGQPEGSWSTVFRHAEHGRNVRWVRDYTVGMTDGTTLGLECVSDLTDRELSLGPGKKELFTLFLCFGRNRGEAVGLFDECTKLLEGGWTPERETERWRSLFSVVRAPAGKHLDSLQAKRAYCHAIAGLHGLFIRGDGGYTGGMRVPWTNRWGIANAFFWDTAFSCLEAREIDPALCEEAIECFAANLSPRGAMPGTLCDTHRAGEGQAPVMAWAAWKTYERGRNKAWLARVYPALAGHIRFWFAHHASERGLCKYFNAGQIGDDDVRFDAVYGRRLHNESIYGFESPDLNALLLQEMRNLSRIAGELGLSAESCSWDGQADAFGKKIVEVFYFSDDAMFYDVKENTREKFSATKGPNMFLPLLADVPLPGAEVARVIETHMLNPMEFFRELPFPSVSYDNPKYEPNGYWRGMIWPHIVYMMIRILWKYGYRVQAELMADRLLRLLLSTPWFHENYYSGTLDDKPPEERTKFHGLPEYNWSHATVIGLVIESYKEI